MNTVSIIFFVAMLSSLNVNTMLVLMYIMMRDGKKSILDYVSKNS
jgi:hypothetical protein